MNVSKSSILITGAGSGLGKATARRLHAAGGKILLTDVNKAGIQALSEELGENSTAAKMDVCSEQDVRNALNIAKKNYGGIDVVVNCAGVPSSAKIVSKGKAHELELWQKVIDINLTGTFNVMRLAAEAMLNNTVEAGGEDRGVIVNTASIAAFEGQKGHAAYSASKAGVVGLTLPVARDLAQHSIRCVAIAPGLFETEILKDIPQKGIDALSKGTLFPSRMGRADEFAQFVQHVIENSYINGACHRLDGGTRLGV